MSTTLEAILRDQMVTFLVSKNIVCPRTGGALDAQTCVVLTDREFAPVMAKALQILRDEHLVEAAASRGTQLRAALERALADEPWVGEIRGRGLLLGIELVADRAGKVAHSRTRRVTERVLAHAKRSAEIGLLLYSATGQANGVDGDQIVLGPPFVIGDAEIDLIARGTAAAIRVVRDEDS